MMSDFYFNEESYYSEKNTYDNEIFRSTVLQLFLFESEQKKTCGNESYEKEINIFTLQLLIYYILE